MFDLEDLAPDVDIDAALAVYRRVRGRRRVKRRISIATVTAVLAASAIGAIAWAGFPHDKPRRVQIVAAPSGSSTPSHMPATTTSIDAASLSVDVRLDSTVVRVGEDVTGTITITNHTASIVTLKDANGCAIRWVAAVAPRGQRPEVSWRAACYPSAQFSAYKPGSTSAPFHAKTTFLHCQGGGIPPGPGQVACQAGGPPPLPAGVVQVSIVFEQVSADVEVPAPVLATLVN